jgi:hypothetical protein
MLLFVHMHKCAGTTVTRSAKLSGLKLPERNGNGNLLDASGRAIRYARAYPGLVQQTIEFQRHLGVQFMAVEEDFPNLAGIPSGVVLFTILRDPFERAVSNFRFAKSRGSAPADLRFRDFFNVRYTTRGPLARSANYYVRKLNEAEPLDRLGPRHLELALFTLAQFRSVIVLGRDDLPSALAELGINQYGTAKISALGNARVELTPEQAAVTEADRLWFEGRNRLDRHLFEAVQRPDWRAAVKSPAPRTGDQASAEDGAES